MIICIAFKGCFVFWDMCGKIWIHIFLNMKCFDTLKIDKSLIDYIGDFSGERLLEHTILLAKELGLCVTAEGVEREEQVDFLKQMKCDSIQGYYYSRPLPKEEFEKLLLTA